MDNKNENEMFHVLHHSVCIICGWMLNGKY